ncbi:MAG: diguanylate cyclase [Desulfobacterales bacterium]|nr:diguanylate cyclase [Desulfobacterales bacterium]
MASTDTNIKTRDRTSRSQGIVTALHFLIIFLAIGAVMTGLITIYYNLETSNHLADIKSREQFAVDFQKQVIERNFEYIFGDLEFLAHQNELQELLQDAAADSKQRVAAEYLAFSRKRRSYDQIRFLDAAGDEIVRVNYNRGAPEIVAARRLQSKGSRYYFREAFVLEAGQIFVSPFDLNIEQGRIETPFKPMIRFATPIVDRQGRKYGVVVLNYLGRNLIDALREAGHMALGNIMLLNKNGYWLCGPDPEMEWGFMLPERWDQRFGRAFPQTWPLVSTHTAGQILSGEGMFTWKTVYPLLRANPGDAPTDRLKGYAWKLVSHIPPAVIQTNARKLLGNLFLLAAALFVLSALPSWLIAQGVVRRKFYQRNLWRNANFDSLTGLANRRFFHYKLDATLVEAKRYDRRVALLFVDLDGFKQVNDNQGHEVGDLLLQKVAARLVKGLRRSDTIARMGGDEFTVILPEIKTANDAATTAGKIITALSKPFRIQETDLVIGASIGIAIHPDCGANADTLIKNADVAMYTAKTGGKNTFRFHYPATAPPAAEDAPHTPMSA